MAGYACPCCGEISDTFGRGGGEAMAQREGVGFLGRVPIDTVLVGLLDAVSKGEIPKTGLLAPIQSGNGVEQGSADSEGVDGGHGMKGTNGSNESESTAETIGSEAAVAAAIQAISVGEDFPLLSRYSATASAKVWEGIARGVVDGIEARRRMTRERLGMEGQE